MIKVFVGFLFAGALACANPVTVNYLSVGDPAATNGPYYVGPYILSIDGGSPAPAMCVDPIDDANPGDSWSANLTELGSGNLSNTYLGSAGAKQYDEAAYLFSLILNGNTDRVGIQEAIWQIMDPTDSDPGIHTSGTDALNWVAQAKADVANFDPSQYIVVSSVNANSSPREQEFLAVVPVPEPSAFALLGLAIVGLGIVPFRKRKQQ